MRNSSGIKEEGERDNFGSAASMAGSLGKGVSSMVARLHGILQLRPYAEQVGLNTFQAYDRFPFLNEYVRSNNAGLSHLFAVL